jgi:hypothetical protein
MGFLMAAVVASLSAQTAPPNPPATPAPAATAVVELSPFTVNTSRDVGYQAENTLAGSQSSVFMDFGNFIDASTQFSLMVLIFKKFITFFYGFHAVGGLLNELGGGGDF